MRGRGGHSSSSSSAIRQQIRMALRKQLIQNISCDSQQDENTQDEASADTDSRDEVSSLLRPPSLTREKQQKERENHSNQKEMTEEEMMELALQLSKQEASNTALKKQREDEDVMKAIQESMVNQTQPCLNSPSKSPLDGVPLSTASRRKLSYSNGEKLPGNGCTLEGDMNSEVVGPRSETITRNKKRKRGTGSPLLEMPDLSETQMSSQNSPSSPESFSSAHLDSPQSSSSTHIDDSQLQMSPVFPLTGCKAEVHINRLNSDLVETCKSTGFVLCSQDRFTLTQSSAQSRSPIFPQSNQISCPKSPVFPGDDEGNEGQPEWNPKFKSPVFGKTAECEMSLHASKHSATENAEFGFFTQESLIPTVRSCPPQSPVLPKRSSDWPLLLIDTDQGQVEQRDERSTSPVFGLTDQQVKPAELRGSEHDQNPPDCSKDIKSDGCQTAECNRHSPKSVLEELNEKPKGLNSAETYLTSDRAVVWSEQDEDDVMLVDSPSPVFPEEKAVVPKVSQPGSSPNHLSESSQEPTGPGCSLKSQKCDPGCNKHVSSGTISASTSTNQQQFHTSGQELHPVSRQEVVPPPGEPSGNQTINYYWGVPFCPRSLDPDTYTQVIVAQMEVYEKSLKQAQRGLLRKAEWGEAIQPQPQKSLSPKAPAESHQPCVSRRRGLRLRGSKRSEAAGFLPDEEEERKDEREDEQQDKEEEEKEGDEVQIDADCEVCPETQLSDNNSTKDLSLDADTEAQPPQKSPELPEIEMVLRDDVPTRDMPLEQRMKTTMDSEMEENVSGCREDAGGQPAGEVEKVNETRKDPGVEEMEDRGLQRSESPELEAAVVPHSPETSVDCPICQGSFPASEIEMHAAYCDGEVTVVDQRRPESQRFQDSVKPRRKRMRRTEAISEETTHLSVSRTQEKCFICQKSVPPKDYSRHTELCLQRGTVRRAAKGNLLSALEQTESRDSAAGPSGSKPQPEAVIDLRDDDDDDDEEEVLAYRISNSPIRSFTPISEATGCLIDFRKQQRTKKPSQRRR